VKRCEQSRQWPLLQPVDVQQALGKEPGAIDLHEGVGVSERGDHQAFLSTVDSDVMRQAVSFACCAVAFQRESVLCPTKCDVASYLFRSAKTGASSSRECNSCEGTGSFAFI
jgi:hypothetical protein